jgi:hypothetical protein
MPRMSMTGTIRPKHPGAAIPASVGLPTAMAASASVVLMVAALWVWGAAPRLADAGAVVAGGSVQVNGQVNGGQLDGAAMRIAHNPVALLWAVRLAAVAAAAGAQVMFLTFVVRVMYRADGFFELLRLAAGLLSAAATVAAAALAASAA